MDCSCCCLPFKNYSEDINITDREMLEKAIEALKIVMQLNAELSRSPYTVMALVASGEAYDKLVVLVGELTARVNYPETKEAKDV